MGRVFNIDVNSILDEVVVFNLGIVDFFEQQFVCCVFLVVFKGVFLYVDEFGEYYCYVCVVVGKLVVVVFIMVGKYEMQFVVLIVYVFVVYNFIVVYKFKVDVIVVVCYLIVVDVQVFVVLGVYVVVGRGFVVQDVVQFIVFNYGVVYLFQVDVEEGIYQLVIVNDCLVVLLYLYVGVVFEVIYVYILQL